MSDRTTNGIQVHVETEWIQERSDPSRNYYFFAYHVTITNVGITAARLLSREWTITDADGNVETVRGPGVVGEQPLLEPGGSFDYTSFCPIRTAMGTMHGSYTMVDEASNTFEAIIDPFTLSTPNSVN